MSRNTIFGRFCVVGIMVLIDKRVVSILRRSYFRVTGHVVGRFILLLFVLFLYLVISILRDPLHSGV